MAKNNTVWWRLAAVVVLVALALFTWRGANRVAQPAAVNDERIADRAAAHVDAFVADIDGRPGDELSHLTLRLAAEGAVERRLHASLLAPRYLAVGRTSEWGSSSAQSRLSPAPVGAGRTALVRIAKGGQVYERQEEGLLRGP
jgi:hypothetical protein